MTGVVLQHARSERGNDLYETPAVAVEALLRVETLPHRVWEPAAGRGRIVNVLQQHALIKLREAGATATHAHGLDQAIRILEGWGLLKGRAS